MIDGAAADESSSVAGADVTAAPLTLLELQQRIQRVDPAALLVAPRILRRIIRQHRQLPGLRWNVPHRKSYILDREILLGIAEADELGIADQRALPATVILLERPSQEDLDFGDLDEVLIGCWRLLFHCRVHAALAGRIEEGKLTPADARQRIWQLGDTPFEEIHNVLEQESFLFPGHDDRDVYVEFAAVYLELAYFAPSLLPRYFPALDDAAAVRGLLARDVNGEQLFHATQPQGAPQPVDRFEPSAVEALLESPESADFEAEPAARQPSQSRFRRLMLKAERVDRTGNAVGAAILAMRADRCAARKLAGKARGAARRALLRLARRLQAALQLPTSDLPAWEALLALLRQTPRGIWTIEARLLYDLQKVCVDAEREVFTVDLVEWALSWGQRPIKRPLPSQRDVLMAKHLRSAQRRLTAVRLSDELRHQLSAVVRAALERAEQRIRRHFRPPITQVFDAVGLTPQNLPERIARRKMIEELLDRVTEQGLLSMGDVRDALSRNQLKLPDVAAPGGLWRDDQLLRADRGLAVALDGVYHRGEFYRRWMQRLSAPGFGTSLGRRLTQYLVVPFGGALLALVFLVHMVEKFGHLEVPVSVSDYALATAALGLFLLGLIHHPAFRWGVWRTLQAGYRLVRGLLFDLPRWLLFHSPLRRILQSRFVRLAIRLGLKPALLTALIWKLTAPPGLDWHTVPLPLAVIFLAMSLLLNSRMARNVEEIFINTVARLWHRVGVRIIIGAFNLIVDVFKWFLEHTERLLYTVDEWLRFRSGESRRALVVKAALGVVWFYVSYATRFCITVLIEPQLNPLKHFPVVTVSHKVLLPLVPHLGMVLSYTMERELAYPVAFVIIASIPGVFGFLVWELKENWRLYAANRSPQLQPVAIGSHGETLLRLLKPGFHSGTLPKRYAKLRQAERRARIKGNWNAVRRHLQALQQVETALLRHVQREFLALFEESPAWQGALPTVESLSAGTNRVQIAVTCRAVAGGTMKISFEQKSGWLLAAMAQPGWSEELTAPRRQVFSMAWIGLCKLGGVQMILRQIETQFPAPMPPYEITADQLVVWPDRASAAPVWYDLHDEGALVPMSASGLVPAQLPTLDRCRLIFAEVPVSWSDWLRAWE
jgi:hypothetical protein